MQQPTTIGIDPAKSVFQIRGDARGRGLGVPARTDRVDARIPTGMGRMLSPEATAPPDPERTRLDDFLRRRKQLVEMRKAGKLRRHTAGPRSCARSRR